MIITVPTIFAFLAGLLAGVVLLDMARRSHSSLRRRQKHTAKRRNGSRSLKQCEKGWQKRLRNPKPLTWGEQQIYEIHCFLIQEGSTCQPKDEQFSFLEKDVH